MRSKPRTAATLHHKTRRLVGLVGILAALLALLILPVHSDGGTSSGGEGGIVVLPGGRYAPNGGSPSGEEGAERLDVRTERFDQGVCLQLPENMPHAIGVLCGPSGPSEPMATFDNLFSLGGAELRSLYDAGVDDVTLMLMSANGYTLTVRLRLLSDGTLRITVY
jgi:hypothetical protein